MIFHHVWNGRDSHSRVPQRISAWNMSFLVGLLFRPLGSSGVALLQASVSVDNAGQGENAELVAAIQGAEWCWQSLAKQRRVFFGNAGYNIWPFCLIRQWNCKPSICKLGDVFIILRPNQTMWYGCSGLPVASMQKNACQNLRQRRRFAMESVGWSSS